MNARRNPDGDYPLYHQFLVQAKCFVKRRIAKPGIAVAPPELPYLIVPILGQSNAYGMGNGLDLSGPDAQHPLVHQWAMSGPSKNKVVAGVDPLYHEVPGKGVGYGVTFAKQLADATNRAVLLIPGARGDTAFTPKNGYTWDVDDTKTRTNLYHRGIAAIDKAMTQYPGSTVAAVLWHQGETDVPLMAAQVYQTKLDRVIDDIRDRYGNELPFLIGQMVPEEMEVSHKDYASIDAVHADTPNRRPRVAFIPGPRGCTNSAKDRHYNGAGQRELGARMWERYQQMCADQLAGYVSA
jgi:Carbohydrate esterase, sialic acid-specific acetylesterase